MSPFPGKWAGAQLLRRPAGVFAVPAAAWLLITVAPGAEEAFQPAITALIENGQWPMLAPDSGKFLFTRLVKVENQREFFGRKPSFKRELWVRDLKSGDDKRVREDVWVVGWAGNTAIATRSELIRVEKGEPVEAPKKVNFQTARWSSDGKRLAFRTNDSKICVTDAGGKVEVALGRNVNFDSDGFIHWSPDGTRVFFSFLFYEPGHVPVQRMGVINPATERVKYVGEGAYVSQNWGLQNSEGAYSAPNAWDSQSRRFLFVSGQGEGNSLLYLSNAAGTKIQVLADDPEGHNSKWSPSFDPAGRRVAFVSGEWGGQDGTIKDTRIRVLDLFTGVEQIIKLTETSPDRTCVTAAWLPDGSGLVYDVFEKNRDLYGASAQIMTAKFPPPAPLPEDTPVKAKSVSPLKDRVLKSLASDNDSIVEWGAENAVRIADPEVIAALRKALSSALKRKVHYPVELLSALRQLDAREAAPELIEAFAAEYEPARCWAVQIIASWRAKAAIEALQALLKKMPDSETAGCAAAALAAMEVEDAWPQLQRLTKNGTKEVRGKIASTLDTVHDSRAVDMLIQLLKDKERLYWDYTGEVQVGDHALDSLVELTGKMLGRDQAAWNDWWTRQGRKLPEVPNPNPGLEQLEREKERKGKERQKELRK